MVSENHVTLEDDENIFFLFSEVKNVPSYTSDYTVEFWKYLR